MTKKLSVLVFILAGLIILMSCSNGDSMERRKEIYKSIKDVPESVWQKLAMKKIYFGHQSVGYNIIDGIQDLMKANTGIKLNIKETRDITSSKENGVFAHSEVGKNTDYKSKIEDFESVVNGNGDDIDIAFLKFCYVDITRESDVKTMFETYDQSVQKLRAKHPKLALIHFTSPLTSTKLSWKQWIKKKIGRKVDVGVDDLVKRNKYNESILDKYKNTNNVLDIASIEATAPDGKLVKQEIDGRVIYSMCSGYTNDGGHLNELGRKKVAEQLLLILASMVEN